MKIPVDDLPLIANGVGQIETKKGLVIADYVRSGDAQYIVTAANMLPTAINYLQVFVNCHYAGLAMTSQEIKLVEELLNRIKT